MLKFYIKVRKIIKNFKSHKGRVYSHKKVSCILGCTHNYVFVANSAFTTTTVRDWTCFYLKSCELKY